MFRIDSTLCMVRKLWLWIIWCGCFYQDMDGTTKNNQTELGACAYFSVVRNLEFEICSQLIKSLPFSTPKIDPHWWKG